MLAPEMESISEMEREQERLPLALYRQAIASAFFETPGRLDVRYLWTRGGVSYFRVNWWRSVGHSGTHEIYRSAFVSIESGAFGPIVHDLTTRAAA